jgi:peptidoglycan/LPS O-acetylase OafA/YrhL
VRRVEGQRPEITPGRLDSLTGARFVAAAGVFLYHASLAFPAQGVFGRALAFVGRNGATGVDFFFALSGFVLAWSWQPGGSVRAFYRRRFARLAPAYWVALVYGLAWVSLLYGDPLTQLLNAVPSLLGVQAWFPDPAIHYAADNPEWSVSAEVFFYAMFPLLIPLAAKRSGRRLLTAAAVVLGVVLPYLLVPTGTSGFGSWLLNVLPAVRIGAFLCGLVLAVALKRGLRVPVSPRVAVAVFLPCYLFVPMTPPWVPHQGILLIVILLVIGSLAQADQWGSGTVLASRLPLRLGEWSYCFYLVHLMTMQIVLFACTRVVPGVALGPVWLITAAAVSTGLAALLHHLVERPLERRLRGTATTAAVPETRHDGDLRTDLRGPAGRAPVADELGAPAP